ncbi:MAG TPA: ABC transporter ATP-binding protein [Planctomycetota bacterium]|jgi:ABC-2 type transport system ATP-binding protein|nr:ABC transporter ATP-binding protein [Planctomycetota bacterium]
MGKESIVEIRGLEKRYGPVRALAGLTLALSPGPTGLLGPNGAGKTTLIKLLLGLLRPDAGEARVAGCDPTTARGRLALRRSVGYMPENDCLLPGLTGLETVATLGRLTGLSGEDSQSRSHEVLDYVGIEEARYRLADEYSSGMKQRLKLAQALVHDPALLLLDEPTSGLDPKGRRHMLDLVHDLGHGQGKSVLLCSHLLPDVERTCDHVVVLRKGSVAIAGPIQELTRVEGRRVRLDVLGDRAAFARRLAESGFAHDADADGRLLVRLDGRAEDADELFALAASSGATLRGVEKVRSSLEQVFVAGMGAEETA